MTDWADVRISGCLVYCEVAVARGKTGPFSRFQGPGFDPGFYVLSTAF